MNAVERARIKRLALRLARTNYAEGVCEANEGEGPTLERRRKASRLSLEYLLAALAEVPDRTDGAKEER